MSAGVPAYQTLQYTLRNSSSTPNILLTHTEYDGELVTSRDDIQYINEGHKLFISSTFPLYSDGLRQTSWSGFKLDDFMSPLILFSVARTSSYYTVNSFVPFEKLLINVGHAWDTCNNQFIVPRTGVYFFSFSSASVPSTKHQLAFCKNDVTMARSFISGGNFSGIDTSSHSLLLPLNAGDTARIFLADGPVYSDDKYQTALSGFLYETIHGQNIAWCLTFPLGVYTYIYGPSSVNFSKILLNNGELWNANLGLLEITTNGTYYLQLSGYSYPATYKLNLIILLNGQPLMNVMEKISIERTTGNLRSRSLIISLQRGDNLTVNVPTGYEAFSYNNDLMFSGFLISA